MSKLNTEEWIKKAREIHNDKYDYSLVEYNGCRKPIKIICPVHGIFEQVAYRHLGGNGCPKCAINTRKKTSTKRKTNDEFIKECFEKYGDKYDYSKVEYRNSHTKICIIDNTSREEILITPTTFLSKGVGDKRGWMNTEKFIEKAKKIHGNKYDYSNTIYEHPKKKIKYICPMHGEIEQFPDNHLKYGCRFCSRDDSARKRRKTTNEFIKEATEKHGDRYDYSKVEYVNSKKKVCIICPEHGEFWQTPSKHLSGHGCLVCHNSRLEEEMMLYLEKQNIRYVQQYSPEFLKNGKGKQKIDFYLPDYNIAIECQGIQHFSPSVYSAFFNVEKNKKRDINKYKKCKENNIEILYYTTKENMKFIDECEIYNDQNLYYDVNETINRIGLLT